MAGKLAIEIVEVDYSAVVNLADETGLTTYDASYLWLARRLKGELITLDGKLQRAAKSL
jgi:predicted nucleic acid-binding protein